MSTRFFEVFVRLIYMYDWKNKEKVMMICYMKGLGVNFI